MNKQTIYTLLSTLLTVIIAAGANAQTKEKESGRSIRETLFKDGGGIKAVAAQPVRINVERELSANSPQALRALIFENYTPPGAKGVALRSAAAPQTMSGNAGAGKLPSETAAGEPVGAKQAPTAVQTPPTQGNAKEGQ